MHELRHMIVIGDDAASPAEQDAQIEAALADRYGGASPVPYTIRENLPPDEWAFAARLPPENLRRLLAERGEG